MFTWIGEVINGKSAFAPFRTQIKAATVVSYAETACKKMWGDTILEHMRPVSFRDGSLKIAVLAGPASAELSRRQSELITHINTLMGREVVRTIYIEH